MTLGQNWNQPCATDWPSSEVQGLAAMYFCMGVGTGQCYCLADNRLSITHSYSLVAAAFSVWTLGGDRLVYWREARR